MQQYEELLTGGNVASRVVRIGSTVRKPATPASASVQALLTYLHQQGFEASPRHLGFDEQGRQVLEYIAGVSSSAHAMGRQDLERVGGIVRKFHDLSANFLSDNSDIWDVAIAPDSKDLVCHNDLAPWNLIQNSDRWVFVDWDGSGPGSRLWELAYVLVNFLPVEPEGDPESYRLRIISVLDGYALPSADRMAMPEMMARRASAMFDLLLDSSRTGKQPWASLYATGHAVYWESAAKYLDEHLSLLRP